jgi:nucleoside-diphosphate-sugar epimerase
VRRVGELGPDTDWREAVAGADAVVHLAARAHAGDDRSAAHESRCFRANAEGTRALAEAAAAAGVRRFVLVSTVKVLGERSDARPFSEADPPRPEDAYARAKRAAEEHLFRVAAAGRMEAVVVRPPLVYGPRVKGNFLSLLRLCRWAPPLPLAAVDNRRSLVYVGNLCDVLAGCVERAEAAGQTYLVRDGEDVSTPELIRRVARALRRPARLFPAPPRLLRLAGRLAGRSAAAARLLDTLVVDDGKVRRDLRWTPAHAMLEGLAETAAWFLGERAA